MEWSSDLRLVIRSTRRTTPTRGLAGSSLVDLHSRKAASPDDAVDKFEYRRGYKVLDYATMVE